MKQVLQSIVGVIFLGMAAVQSADGFGRLMSTFMLGVAVTAMLLSIGQVLTRYSGVGLVRHNNGGDAPFFDERGQ